MVIFIFFIFNTASFRETVRVNVTTFYLLIKADTLAYFVQIYSALNTLFPSFASIISRVRSLLKFCEITAVKFSQFQFHFINIFALVFLQRHGPMHSNSFSYGRY